MRAQIFSFDALVATVVFILIVAIVVAISGGKTADEETKLRVSSQLIASRIISGNDPLSVMDPQTNEVDPAKLNALVDRDYGDLKEDLGIKEDFCILVIDETGSIVLVGNESTGQRVGIGNRDLKFNISDLLHNCSQNFTG